MLSIGIDLRRGGSVVPYMYNPSTKKAPQRNYGAVFGMGPGTGWADGMADGEADGHTQADGESDGHPQHS